MPAGFQHPAYYTYIYTLLYIVMPSSPAQLRPLSGTSLCCSINFLMSMRNLFKGTGEVKLKRVESKKGKVNRPSPCIFIPLCIPAGLPLLPSFGSTIDASNTIISIQVEEPASPCSPSCAGLCWILRLPQARSYEY